MNAMLEKASALDIKVAQVMFQIQDISTYIHDTF